MTQLEQQPPDPNELEEASEEDAEPESKRRGSLQIVVEAFRDISIRLIDKGHVAYIPVTACAIALIVIAVELPALVGSKGPEIILAILAHESFILAALASATAILLFGVLMLISLVFFMRRVYQAEINRQADTIRQLQQTMDPHRLSSRPLLPHESLNRRRDQ